MQTRSMIRNQTATKENDGCDVNHDQTQIETIRLPPTKLNYDALEKPSAHTKTDAPIKSNQEVISWILLGMGEQHAFQEMYDLLDTVENDARKLKQEKKIYLKNMIQAVRKPVQYLPDTMKIVKFHPEAAKAIKAFPESLEILDCSNCQLKSLPPLPSSLKMLICRRNMLSELPELPESLVVLYCDNNLLTTLPRIPASVRVLVGFNNDFARIPKIPKTVTTMNLEKRIVSLPYKNSCNNKSQVEEFVRQNPQLKRSNCGCDVYGTNIKELTPEQRTEFLEFAYYCMNDGDKYYTCGVCANIYIHERDPVSWYFKN
jgi:hypothetical protein